MVEISRSRTGHTTASCDGTAIHSPYDPVREARRFIEASTPDASSPPGTIIVLGEGVGHLSRAAREKHPKARVLAVHYAPELWAADPQAAHASWRPASGASIEAFLRANLSEIDIEGLRVLEWQPSSAAFPTLSRRALDAVAQVVRELNGTVATGARNGRLWLRNSVRNFLLGPDPLLHLPVELDLPIVIAASGPSLAQASPLLRRFRGSVSLWALPSAVDHLLAVGLEPDLVVVTDPAYYSVYHVHAARARELAFAMPLSASPGVWRVSSRVHYLPQPTFYELSLLRAFGLEAGAVAPHGTVAGTALEMAIGATASSSAPVVLAGLDLCYHDILSHARPNAFEHFLIGGSGRLEPLHHRMAIGALDGAPVRIGGSRTRTSLPLQTYAGWFAAGNPAWAGRVRRLLPSPVALPSLPAITEAELRDACTGRAHSRAMPEDRLTLDRSSRRGVLGELLRTWRGQMRVAADGPAGHPQAIEISRHLALRELIELRRAARLESATEARDIWKRIVRDVESFLASIEEEIEGHRDA